MSHTALAFVLAAGLGTRMRSKTCKVLYQAAGRPLIAHVLDVCAAVDAHPVVVLSRESEPARAVLPADATVAIQEPPNGTGDAVRVALGATDAREGLAYVVYGDTPVLRAETLAAMRDLLRERDAVIALLMAKVGTDNAYGRIVRNEQGDVRRIVEVRNATAEERTLPESNLGAYAMDLGWLRTAVGRLRANKTGEVYLTDLAEIAIADGKRVAAYCSDDRVKSSENQRDLVSM